jgi:hypothetical protein
MAERKRRRWQTMPLSIILIFDFGIVPIVWYVLFFALLLMQTCISKLVTRRFSGITFIRYTQNWKMEKANNFKIFGSNKTKGPKQDSQNRLRSPMPGGGQSYFYYRVLKIEEQNSHKKGGDLRWYGMLFVQFLLLFHYLFTWKFFSLGYFVVVV